MHANVSFAHFAPQADQDEGVKIYRDSVMPELKQLEGYKSSLFCIERLTGKVIAVSLYEQEAHIKMEHHQNQLAKLAHLLSAPPAQEVYEVTVKDSLSGSGIRYTRVTLAHSQASTDKQDELIKIYHDSILPELKQQPGNDGALLLVNRATGKVISFTLWESEESLRASEHNRSYQRWFARLAHLLTMAVRETFEVAAQDLT